MNPTMKPNELPFVIPAPTADGGAGVAASDQAPLWTPANLASPPHISVDADRTDLRTIDGSNNLTGITTEFTALAADTPSNVLYVATLAALNNHACLRVSGNAAQSLNFAGAAASLLANKPGCTMVFFGKFEVASPTAVNRAVVNATTTSATATRCSLGTSPTVANCPRTAVRRLDADAANGDDLGNTNRGVAPFIAIVRMDNNGTVIGSGTPTKQIRFTQSGAREVGSEATGLGSGNYSNTNSAYIGFFNSGTSAPARNEMNWGAIDDTVWTDDEVERLEGYLAWKIGMPEILPSDHPYRNTPPRQT